MEGIRTFFNKFGLIAILTVNSVIVFFALIIVAGIAGWERFPQVYQYFVMPVHGLDFIYVPWTLLTHHIAFHPTGFMQLVVDLLLLWSFGLLLQGTVGQLKTTRLILFSLLVTPLASLLLCSLFPWIEHPAWFSGLHFVNITLVAANMMLLPRLPVRIFFLIEVPLVALGLVIIGAYLAMGMLIFRPVGVATLLAAGVGVLYVIQLRKGSDFTAWITKLFEEKPRKKNLRVVHRETPVTVQASARKTSLRVVTEEPPTDPEAELNRILDKINAVGWQNLTRQEKEFLEKYSKQ